MCKTLYITCITCHVQGFSGASTSYQLIRLKLFPGKLKSKWSGPFTIKEVMPYGAVELFDPHSSTPDTSWVVNGQRLKLYHGGSINRLNTII